MVDNMCFATWGSQELAGAGGGGARWIQLMKLTAYFPGSQRISSCSRGEPKSGDSLSRLLAGVRQVVVVYVCECWVAQAREGIGT
jgi:hypothetical protein